MGSNLHHLLLAGLTSLTSLLAAVPASAEAPAAPLVQLSAKSFTDAAGEAVRGDLTAWQAWLAGKLNDEISRSGFAGDPASVAKLAQHPVLSAALAQWRLLALCGAENVQKVAAADGAEFLTWLFTTPEALHAFLASGPQDKEGTARGLEIWRDIWKTDKESHTGLWLRVAAATALTHTVPVKSLADGGDIDPLKRYQHYRNAHASGILFDSFSKAAVWELRYVVNSWARDEELSWVVNASDKKNHSQEKIGEACWMVEYRDVNSKGVSVQNGPEYYDHKPVTLQLMDEVGGVCGAISKFGTAAAQAFGVPAMPVGQPGHCAFLWKKDPQTWRTGNDISGWAGSSEHGGIFIHWGNRGSYVLLTEAAHRDPAKFLACEQATWAAAVTKDAAKSAKLRESAVQILPLHAGAWQDLIRTRAEAKAPVETWQALTRDVLKALPDFPVPLDELLATMEPHLSLNTPEARRAYTMAVCRAIAGGSMEAQNGCAQPAQADIVARMAALAAPKAGRRLARMLAGDEEEEESADAKAPRLTEPERKEIQSLAEAAIQANAARPDLQNALTGRYLGLMTSDPASMGRAIQFFGALFDQAKTNPDRKPAIALARRLIIMAEKAEDLAAMEKYSAECQKLLK